MSYFIAHENKTEIVQYDIMGRKLKSYLGHTDQITRNRLAFSRTNKIYDTSIGWYSKIQEEN